MFPIIVADIGGTNARFALAVGKQGDQFLFEHIHVLKGKDYPDFEDALAAYIGLIGDEQPVAACVSLAAPIDGDFVAMTNIDWSFSQDAMRKKFGLKAFAAINDYTSVAIATSRLAPEDLHSLIPGTRKDRANKAVLGPGTGLGVGGLSYAGQRLNGQRLNGQSLKEQDHWVEIPAEGGHVTMGPADAFEAEVIGAAIACHGYVSAETCISGPGLVNLYRAIADVKGQTALDLKPHDVSAKGLDGSDALCVDALSTFCSLLGTMSSNLALTYAARGGVYITGGIVPRMVDFLKQSDFEKRFREKGVMSRFVADIPVDLVTYSETAYLGAAAWLEQRL